MDDSHSEIEGTRLSTVLYESLFSAGNSFSFSTPQNETTTHTSIKTEKVPKGNLGIRLQNLATPFVFFKNLSSNLNGLIFIYYQLLYFSSINSPHSNVDCSNNYK